MEFLDFNLDFISFLNLYNYEPPPVLWTGLKGEFLFKIDRAVIAQSRV